MNATLSRTQKEICNAAREFARGEFDADIAGRMDREGCFPRKAWQKAGELGFIGMDIPEKFGGGGFGCIETVLVAETLCAKDASMGIVIGMADIMAECLHRFGSAAQKAQFLPGICEGRIRCGFSLDDLKPGWPAGGRCCRLAAVDGHLELCGDKPRVVHGCASDIWILACRETLPDPAAGSLVIVERTVAGHTISAPRDQLGMRPMALGDHRFDGARIPVENRLGKPGGAKGYLCKVLPAIHLRLAGMALGIAQGALDRSLDYVRKRTQFGRKIAQFQAIRHKLADMALELASARSLTYRAADMADAGRIDGFMTTAARLAASDAAVHLAYEAIQLHGGYGYMAEYAVERFYREAKMLQLAGGTRNRLNDTLADHLVGKRM